MVYRGFRVGNRVRLVNNKCMAAPVGSVGTVSGFETATGQLTTDKTQITYLSVTWDRPISQCDGGYEFEKFEKLPVATHTLGDILMALELAEMIDNDIEDHNQYHGTVRSKHVWTDTWLRNRAIAELKRLVG